MPYADPDKARANARKWYREHKDRYVIWRKEQYKRQQEVRAVVARYKANHGCCDCHNRKLPAEALDFDHIPARGKKIRNIAHMVSNGCSLQNILKEIEKCDVVCATCHRIREIARRKKKRAAK